MSEREDCGRYQGRKSRIRAEIEANEGHPSPDAKGCWRRAKYAAESVVGWIDDVPLNEETIQTAKGDILTALVALEMAEERYQDTASDHGADAA